MHGVILERDDQSADSAAGGHPVAILHAVQYFLPALGFALLKIECGKNKKQGKQQEDAQAAARGTLKQKHTYCVIHHSRKIAFTAARTLASQECESLYPDL